MMVAHELRPVLGRAGDLLRAHRARRGRLHWLYRDDVLRHRHESLVVRWTLAAPVRGGGGRHRRILAGGSETKCHREHGTGADQVFTPLFTLLLLAFLVTMAWTGNPINVKREVLIGFDLLLRSSSAWCSTPPPRADPQAAPDFFDGLQLLLVTERARSRWGRALGDRRPHLRVWLHSQSSGGLLARISFCSSTWRGRRGSIASFLRHRGSFAALEGWQIAYLPVYSIWRHW